MIVSFHGSGTESIDTNCDWSKPGTPLEARFDPDVRRGDRPAELRGFDP